MSGGENNSAYARFSMVAGGSNNIATGIYGAVAGGWSNQAAGHFSFAAGSRAKALQNGCFVWGDATDTDIDCTTVNMFIARATGGVQFVTAIHPVTGTPTAGADLAPGDSSWNLISDRAAKSNWKDVDSRVVLERLAAMPIGEWSYRAQSDAIRHMGPSAQDFRAAFGLGHSDLRISTVDADGVALAAIQGLNRKLEDEVRRLEARNAALDEAVRALGEQIRTLKLAGRD